LGDKFLKDSVNIKLILLLTTSIISLFFSVPYSDKWAKKEQKLFTTLTSKSDFLDYSNWESPFSYWIFRIGFVFSVLVIVGIIFSVLFGSIYL